MRAYVAGIWRDECGASLAERVTLWGLLRVARLVRRALRRLVQRGGLMGELVLREAGVDSERLRREARAVEEVEQLERLL
jgi:hypothetical protein